MDAHVHGARTAHDSGCGVRIILPFPSLAGERENFETLF